MTKRLIPERTVDSLLAAEVILALPEALIWSPSNTAGMWDHAVLSQFGRLIVFECKGVVSNAAREPTAPWRVPIDVPQLDAYVVSSVAITYLLVSRPGDLRVPWRRFCNDGRADGMCSACYAPQGTTPRRWAGSQLHVNKAKSHVRMQPWFNHWAWCIPATSLQKHLGGKSWISARDQDLAAIPHAVRLCHLFEDLTGKRNGHPDAGAISESFVAYGEDAVFRELSVAGNESGEDGEGTPPVIVGGL